MDTLELLKVFENNYLDLSEAIKKDKDFSLGFSEVFKNVFSMTSLSLRYYQRSICELSELLESPQLRIEIDRCEVLNNYQPYCKRNIQVSYLDELNIPIDVSIGQIELSVADLIAIERGESIVSKLPPLSKVALLIAGEKVAEASFEVDDEMIILKINEIFLKKIEEPSDNTLNAV